MKKIKGFTLIELIIVMAILTILMAGILNMMKPIRATFLDSTLYESQRTTQNGVIKYITENTRYATNLGIYNENAGSGGVADAVTKFKTATGVTDSTTINIITIDNTDTYSFNSHDVKGRLLRSRVTTNAADTLANAATIGTGEGFARLVLGESYYGPYTYSIDVVANATDKSLHVSVSSLLTTNLNNAGGDTGNVVTKKHVMTDGEVVCLNLAAPINGKFDTSEAGTGTATSGKNTYIIFTLPD